MLALNQTRNIGLLIMIAIVFHGALLPYSVESTYDAYIHMFFGDHYRRSWFDPWEPRWYTGFSVTSYPPATHMIMGLLQHICSLKIAYFLTMLLGIATLIIGFYRFVRIWAPEAAFISTVLLIFASSVTETIHLFGQLPTIFSLGIFLNAMPHVYRWLVFGHIGNLFAALIISGAATSAHHVTTIFGSVFFIGPLAAYAWMMYLRLKMPFANGAKPVAIFKASIPVLRGVLLAVLILAVVIFTVFPYWYWSFTDPINQVPIPHGTRESFLHRIELGVVFFIIPWGVTLIFLPYIFYRGFTSILWPFAASMLLCFILGTGGTTQIPRMILRGAFDILTLDRFTFWATILAIPFVGLLIVRLENGQMGRILNKQFGKNTKLYLLATILFSYALSAVAIGTLGAFKKLQPEPIDPAPIVQFMESDEHYRWRYLTLGFGDQFAYISAQTSALSVDGNYHSARRLPDLTNRSVERLENAKYLGVGGIGSLQQFLMNANNYHLKYIFSNDSFYNPLLYAAGWNSIVRLPNNIVVWEKPNIEPLPFTIPRKNFPTSHRIMWGLVPITMCLFGFIIISFSAVRMVAFDKVGQNYSTTHRKFNDRRDIKALIFTSSNMLLILLIGMIIIYTQDQDDLSSPINIIKRYHQDLNLRKFEEAYELLDPKLRDDYDEFFFAKMWDGGLINSFGELQDISITKIGGNSFRHDYIVTSQWLTSLGIISHEENVRTIKRGKKWHIVSNSLPTHETAERVMGRNIAEFHTVGRRQALPETDLYKDMPDRPQFALRDARLIKYDGQYSIIGLAGNTDVDPMNLSFKGELFDQDENSLIFGSSGLAMPFHMMPSEISGFKLDFEGRLSIKDAEIYDGFNPEIFVPPVYDSPPKSAYLGVSSVIDENGSYRSIMLSDISSYEINNRLEIRGRAVNNGIKILTTVKILTTLYGQDGKPAWVEIDFIEDVLRPGQTTDFKMTFPKRENIEVIFELSDQNMDLNLNLKNSSQNIPDSDFGTIPLNGKGGYQSMRLYVDPYVYNGVF